MKKEKFDSNIIDYLNKYFTNIKITGPYSDGTELEFEIKVPKDLYSKFKILTNFLSDFEIMGATQLNNNIIDSDITNIKFKNEILVIKCISKFRIKGILFKEKGYKKKLKMYTQQYFNEKLDNWINKCQDIINNYCKEHKLLTPTLQKLVGKRYIKIVEVNEVTNNKSVYAFIDITNGDVLKAASWSAPAKHARGNIFDQYNGLYNMNRFGPLLLFFK